MKADVSNATVTIWDEVSVENVVQEVNWTWVNFTDYTYVWNITDENNIRLFNYTKEINFTLENQNYSAGCAYLHNETTFYNYTKLCRNQGIFYANDSNVNGVFIMNHYSTVDCNGLKIQGNKTSNSQGIKNTISNYNIVIKNCTIDGYAQDIKINRGINITIINNTLSNSSNQLIYVERFRTSRIENNVFYNSSNDNIYVIGSSNSLSDSNIFKNNIFLNPDDINKRNIYFGTQTKDNNITGNYFGGYGLGLYAENTTNFYIQDNVFLNNKRYNFIELYLINDTYIRYNNFTTTDTGIYLHNSSFNLIDGNRIMNISTNYDIYVTGIRNEYASNNNTIQNNTIEYATLGILIRQSNGTKILTNIFNQISLSDKIRYGIYDLYEPTAAIGILEIYKGFLGDSSESSIDDIDKISLYKSGNALIQDNVFSSDVQTYLRMQGSVNVQHDLTSYWYLNQHFPTYLLDAEEYYNSNSFNQLINLVWSSSDYINSMFIISYDSSGGTLSKRKFNYTLYDGFRYFKNVNTTHKYNITLWNLTLDYSYNQIFNGTSTLPTAENVNIWNESVGANERVLVFSYETATQPKFTSIPTTVNYVLYSYTYADKLIINCTGTGAIVLENLDELRGSNKYIMHYKDGSFVDTIQTDSYTQASCSSHVYTTAEVLPLAISSPTSSTILTKIIAVIVALIILIVMAYPIVHMGDMDWTTQQWLYYFITSFIVTILYIVLIISIFEV